MKPTECLKALGRAHTYNLGRNECLRAGLFLGLIVSILLLAGVAVLSGIGGKNPLREIEGQPLYLLMLAHPVLFGVLFGAMGTIKRDLDLLHERDLTMLSGLAMTDPLTGLYNRRYVEEELKNLLHRTERTGEPVSVVFFDLDHFKEVNQKHGHRGGDLTLKMVAEALQTVLRQGEILGRYGGDEFLLVVAADLPYATNLVERAVAAVQLWTRLSISAGVARSRDDGTTPEELIAAADARLAKVQAHHHAEQSLARQSQG
jgi:diguanylate cyclase (GGDEF)-like protein